MKYKVFIGLIEIAGYYGNLNKGFQEIGVDSTFINLFAHPFHYNGDDQPNIFVKIYKKNLKRITQYNNTLYKVPLFIINQMLKVPIFFWALKHFDIFIFGYGTSFFNYLDLPILKICNKKIIFVFHGSDARPPYIDGARHNITLYKYKQISRTTKLRVTTIEKYADHIISYPTIAQFNTKKYINSIMLGKTQCIAREPSNLKHDPVIRILHAPSDPIGKGSAIIRAAIENLKSKGYSINYIEITGKTNSEVIRELSECDFVIDQAFSDLPLPTFATEAASFGKPAVISGYYALHIHDDYEAGFIPPSLYCHPDEIELHIELLIVDPEYRSQLGKKAEAFVKGHWTPKKVAERYLQVIDGTIPDIFLFDPNTTTYVQGYGLPEEQSKEIISNMIEEFGIESLCLSDKPELEEKFRNYAENYPRG